MRVLPGSPDPLGATWDGEGVNFALFSEHATSVRLCLFDKGNGEPAQNELKLPHRTHGVWHGYFPDLRPGQRYAYRVDGPHRPDQGHCFNPNKLLLDPYAHAIDGPLHWNRRLRSHLPGDNPTALDLDPHDSATVLPRCVVIDPAFVWGEDRPLRTPWNRSVIYECHVKGLTQLHPEIPEKLRGTFLGLASEPIIEHLRSLGVTALELLPIQQSLTEEHLVRGGLTNYWGYNPIGFFSPDERFASTPGLQVEEFKSMVK
ncbi:MAG: glycogen debranching enzyme GlgX, partial [Deltaproteobacteria bacterium]|nr:glycogen debranching enzyme GlgX [Deltaproteobacteria bacterium]